MFSSLFPKGKITGYVGALSKLQDILGTLHDIAVAHLLLDKMDDEKYHDALILIRGWLEHDYADNLSRLAKQWKHFSARKPFWI